MTIDELIARLQAARNKKAVVCLCVDDFQYAPISECVDETALDNENKEIGNFLLRIDPSIFGRDSDWTRMYLN